MASDPIGREETVSSRQVFAGRILRVRDDEVRLVPGGRLTRREVVEHPGAVAIVAVGPDQSVVLVRQYRYAAGQALLEIPAGTLRPGEDPAACAERELAEETGAQVLSLEPLATLFVSPGFCTERVHLYLARLGQVAAGDPHPDEDERLEVVVLPLAEALAMVRDGRLPDAKSAAGLLLARDRLDAETRC